MSKPEEWPLLGVAFVNQKVMTAHNPKSKLAGLRFCLLEILSPKIYYCREVLRLILAQNIHPLSENRVNSYNSSIAQNSQKVKKT